MTPAVPRETDPLVRALARFVRECHERDVAKAERRATMELVQGGKRDGGRAA